MDLINNLVTVIILTYKKYSFLFDSLQSVLEQDYPNIELIVSDDSSGDFPYNEVLDFIERNKKINLKNYQIVINENNVGTVKNLNNAYRLGRGEYFLGLSSDDQYYSRSSITNIVERFQLLDTDVLCCRRLRCGETDLKPLRYMPSKYYITKITRLNTPFKQYRAFALLQYYEMASGSALYFRRAHFLKFGYFDERYCLWEDGPFFAKFTREGHLLTFAYDLVTIKYREGGISSKKNQKMLEDHRKFLRYEVMNYLQSFNLFDQQYIKYLSRKANGKPSNKSKWCNTATLYHPFSMIRFLTTRIIFKTICLFDRLFHSNIL